MSKTRSTTCCGGLTHLLDNAGQKGLSVIVANHYGELWFRLQSRAVVHAHKYEISIRSTSNITVNISQSVTIKHCPFCGKKLSKLLDRSPAHYRDLATRHQALDDAVI